MDKDSERLRWGVTRRMEFLDQRLFWAGRVNRADLIQEFHVSVPQASADLSQYQAIAPGNVRYDKSAKTYVATENFAAAFGIPSAVSYLDRLGGVGDGNVQIVRQRDCVFLPELKRRIDPLALRRVVRAIRECKRIRIHYQSMSSEELSWRWVAPHALAFDGHRWHVRAFCERRAEFRDFVLSRIFDTDEEQPSAALAACDMAWTNQVTLRLVPNPKLSAGIRGGLEREYDMKSGSIEITTPVCFAFYLGQTLGLDNPEATTHPARFQIVVANGAELCEAKDRAERETHDALSAIYASLEDRGGPDESIVRRPLRTAAKTTA